MTDLRDRIAEVLEARIAVYLSSHPQNVRGAAERAAAAVMVEVQRDLDEVEARVERKMARLRQAGEVIDAAEADAARLAEALDAYQNHAAPHEDEFSTEDVWRYYRARAALAAHRERENQTNDGGTCV